MCRPVATAAANPATTNTLVKAGCGSGPAPPKNCDSVAACAAMDPAICRACTNRRNPMPNSNPAIVSVAISLANGTSRPAKSGPNAGAVTAVNAKASTSLMRCGTACSPKAGNRAIIAPTRKNTRKPICSMSCASPTKSAIAGISAVMQAPAPQSPGAHPCRSRHRTARVRSAPWPSARSAETGGATSM